MEPGDNDLSVTSRFSFFAKNENPFHRRDPIIIPRLWEEDRSPHVLLRSIYQVLLKSLQVPLFISIANNKPMSKASCAYKLCSIIKESQPGVFPRSHDIRKMATSLAFFSNMSLKAICAKVGWASPVVFRKHYLKQIQGIVKNCIVLGTSLPM